MRFSCLTSKFVCVVSGNVNVFQWNREWFFSRRVKFWLWVQRDGGIWSFLTWTNSHLTLHRHPEVSLEVVEETLLILQENQSDPSPRIDRCRIKVDVPRSWSPPRCLIRPYAAGKINFSILGVKYHLLCIESFRVDFWCVPSFPTPQCLRSVRPPFQIPPAYRGASEEQSR